MSSNLEKLRARRQKLLARRRKIEDQLQTLAPGSARGPGLRRRLDQINRMISDIDALIALAEAQAGLAARAAKLVAAMRRR
ncbi:MAG: hypothetical protein ABL957_06205 [Parvularculaceae bacterium]